MFGDFCFADTVFSGILKVVIINYKTVHGRTKVLAVVEQGTGKVYAIDLSQNKFKIRTKVTENKLKSFINASNNTDNVVFENPSTPSPSP